MKLALQVLFFASLAACGSGEAGGVEPVGTPPSGAATAGASKSVKVSPRLVFQTTTLDFGEVWDTGDMVGRFPFVNEGGKPLTITEVKPSCGCTTTELAKTRFEPGEGDALELVWKPKGFGSQAKTITVRSNSEGPGIDVLTIQARIKPFAEFSENPLRWGDLKFGQEHRKRVFLTCADPDFELLDLRSGHRSLTAEVVGKREDGAVEVEFVLDDRAPWGLLTCSLQASVRGVVPEQEEKREHVAVLQISGSLFGDLRMQPTMFGIGHVLPGRSFERRTRMTHATGEPFRIVSAKVLNSQPPGMTVRFEPVPPAQGGGTDLVLSGEAKDYLGLIRGTVVVLTDIPGEQQRTLPVYGIVRE